MQIKNGAELLKPKVAFAQTSVTAGGSGDNTKIIGEKIDRIGYESGLLVINANSTIATTKTLSYAVEIQDSADGTNWNAAVVLQALTVVYTAVGATTNIVTETPLVVGLAKYGRYVRFNVTPDLNASGTDTSTVNGLFVLTDGRVTPEELAFTTIVKD